MEACPFCRIISGDFASTIIYRDESCCAFLSSQPINPGHILLVPNQHALSLEGLQGDTAELLFRVSQRLARGLRHSGIPCQAVNLFLAEGNPASPGAAHLQLHIIPRLQGDGFDFQTSPRSAELPTREELEKNAYHIVQSLEKQPQSE